MAPLLLLKATLLLGGALAGARLLQRSAAATRHRFWSLAFAALLALPPLALALPALYVPLPAWWQSAPASLDALVTPRGDSSPAVAESRAVTRVEGATAAAASGARPAVTPATFRARVNVSRVIGAILLTAWIGGTIACLSALLLSVWRVVRLSRSAQEVNDPAWTAAASDVGARFGVRRTPRLLVADVATPMAGGLWRPIVVLPRSALVWTAERRDVVLAHEIAHIAGRDALRHVAARLAVALYWFHPLVWLAARHASVAREQACDAAVLARGTRPSAYAQVLLDLADSPAPHVRLAALPIVERSLLETRLMAILDSDHARMPARRLLAPAATLALTTFALAAAQPALSGAALGTPAVDMTVGPSRQPAAPRVPGLSAGLPFIRSTGSPQSQDSACDWDSRGSFSGTMSTRDSGGRSVVTRQIGYRGNDRIIQDTIGELRLCMVAEGTGDRRSNDGPSAWVAGAPHVLMEVVRGSRRQTLEIDRRSGAARTIWRVGQSERPFDAAAGRWRDRLLAALDSTWEISTLLGEQSSLRGQISSIRGEESSLRGEISSLRGEVSSMRGRQSSVRGEESSLRGEISSIQGHVSSLRGEIASEQGAISSLTASRYGADAGERAQIADRIARHDAEIARVEREIRDYNADARVADVERQIRALDADGKVAAIDSEIRAFDLDGKVAAIDRKIKELDVEGKTAAIEKQIAALDADRRADQIERRRDDQLKQLAAAIDAIR